MNQTDVIYLLRGLTRESRHWEGFDEKLQAKLPEVKVVCLDLPGFGVYHEHTSPSSIDEIARFVFNSKEYVEHKNAKKHVLSLSLGGMVTLEMIYQRPLEFDKIIIINSSQKLKTPFYKRLNIQFAPTLGMSFLLKDINYRERLILKYTLNTKFDETLIEKWVNFFEEKPFSLKSAALQFQAGSAFNLEGKIEPLKASKGLVLISEKDRLVNSESSETIAELLGWPVKYHPNAGHDMTYDDPDWVIEKTIKHLKKS